MPTDSAAAILLSKPTRSLSSDELRPGVEECPETISASRGLATYDRFVEQALELPPQGGALLAMRISPSFQPERALTLRRTTTGAYVLRSTRLLENVWGQMMANMQRQQGAVVHLDEKYQAQALADVQVTREVHERFVDASTAELLLTVWAAALGRDQVTESPEIMSVTLDGTGYRIWTQTGAISMANPRGALGIAISGVHNLEEIVEEPSSKDCARLQAAVTELLAALHRIRNNGPCVVYDLASRRQP